MQLVAALNPFRDTVYGYTTTLNIKLAITVTFERVLDFENGTDIKEALKA